MGNCTNGAYFKGGRHDSGEMIERRK